LFFDVKRKGAMRYPYIGVTGFTSQEQVDRALIVFPREHRKLMVGVLVNPRTLAGGENKWKGRYPRVEAIPSIFRPDPRCLNIIHYNADDPARFPGELCRIERLAGPSLHGFQLNLPWPDPELVEDYRRSSGLERPIVILQVGEWALRDVDYDPEILLRSVLEYGSLIDYVLLDPSGGRGAPLSAEDLLGHLEALRSGTRLGLGVAGGLSAKSLDLLDPLRSFKGFSELSIDGEGRLRDWQADELQADEVEDYLLASLVYFERAGVALHLGDHIHGGSNPSNGTEIW
jgi:hypothetical protein